MSLKGKPLVSIIVPVYNAEKYLSECLDSVLTQTYQKLEVILINDGSTDNSRLILEKYAKEHSNITIIDKKNGGLSDARNSGIMQSHGDYLCFLDSDDVISSVFIETLLQNMRRDKTSIACCRFERESVKKLSQTIAQTDQVISSRKYLLNTYYQKDDSLYTVSVGPKLFATPIFKNLKFPVGLLYEDFAVIDKILLQSDNISIIDCPLYYYRRNINSITTGSFNRRHLDMINHCDKLLSKYRNDPDLYAALVVMKYTRCIEILTKMQAAKYRDITIEKKMWTFMKSHRHIAKDKQIRQSLRFSIILLPLGRHVLVKVNSIRQELMKFKK